VYRKQQYGGLCAYLWNLDNETKQSTVFKRVFALLCIRVVMKKINYNIVG
jgi:hypothetical protein